MIEAVLKRGTLVAVVMAMVMLLGITAATRVPVQMIPDLEVRTVTIQTRWPGATPQDVENEILIEQEQYLRGLPNLARMVSEATTGEATIRRYRGVPPFAETRGYVARILARLGR